MPRSLFSYVVVSDDGFAPNPFFGYCTLATCKPRIRKRAQIGDWIVGTGSAARGARGVERRGHLVYAMRVTEVIGTRDYWIDPRFQFKKPTFKGDRIRVSASGDNIYEWRGPNCWRQLPSYHSHPDGTQDEAQTKKDTDVERILSSDDFVYFGGEGPRLPSKYLNDGDLKLVCNGRGDRRKKEPYDIKIINSFEKWIRDLGVNGVCGVPLAWLTQQGRIDCTTRRKSC